MRIYRAGWLAVGAIATLVIMIVAVESAYDLGAPRAEPTPGASQDSGCFSRVMGSATYTWCDTGGATPNLIYPSFVPASGGAGGIGISAGTAIRLARSHVAADATFVSAASRSLKGWTVDAPDQLIWAITFTAQYRICPPLAGTCLMPRAGQTIVILDYRTGNFVESSTSVPPPRSN
jgi:hypothetical protein